MKQERGCEDRTWVGRWVPPVPALLVFLFFLTATGGIIDNDVWLHLRYGEDIVTHGALPQVDTYSHTKAGTPLLLHAWLGEAVFYEAWRWAGFLGIILLRATVLAGSLAVVAFWLDRMNLSLLTRSAVILFGGFLLHLSNLERPMIFTHLFFATTCVAVFQARIRWRPWIWALAPLTCLWSNMHGGFIEGILVVLAAGLCEGAESILFRAQRIPQKRAVAGQFILLSLLMALCACVNPYGARILAYPFQYLTWTPSFHQSFILEWWPPDFHKMPALALYMVILVGLLASRRPVGLTETALALLFMTMTLKHRRVAGQFVLLSMPILAQGLDHAGSRLWASVTSGRWRRIGLGLGSMGRSCERLRPLSDAGSSALWLGLLWMAFVAPALALRHTAWANARFRVDETRFPAQSVAYLRDHHVPGEMFNDYDWGGYLMWTLRDQPGYPVFIDGRADMYGDAFLKEVAGIECGRRDWQERLRWHGVNFAVVRPQSEVSHKLAELPGEWEEVLSDETERLYIRKVPASKSGS